MESNGAVECVQAGNAPRGLISYVSLDASMRRDGQTQTLLLYLRLAYHLCRGDLGCLTELVGIAEPDPRCRILTREPAHAANDALLDIVNFDLGQFTAD